MKRKINFIILVFVLILSFSFVLAVEEFVDISKEAEIKEKSVKGKGVTYESDIHKVNIQFKEENAVLHIDERIFTNIIPIVSELDYSYFGLDKQGNITEAYFKVDEMGSYYNFSEGTIYAPANSYVNFTEGKIEIQLAENTDLSGLNFLDLISGDLTTIKGNNIKLGEDFNLRGLGKEEGVLRITPRGYLLEWGEVDYKKMKLNGNLLIANSGVDLSDYKGNWIKQTSEALEIQSSESDYVSVNFLGGHDILNTDEKDRLRIDLISGDGIRFEKRVDEGLIPKAIHKSSGGETLIKNDKIIMRMLGDEFVMDTPEFLDEGDLVRKYQSVAFEIESDSSETNEKIRMNSYRQFVVLDENDEERVTYNKHDLPISSLIKDNELQTVKQLREKWGEDIYFQCEDYERQPDEDCSLQPPLLLHITDEFLESNSGAVEDLSKIKLLSIYGNAYARGVDEVGLGLGVLDPVDYLTEIRDMTSPFQVLTHEYEHILDNKIEERERDNLPTEKIYDLEEQLREDYRIYEYNEKIMELQLDFKELEYFAELDVLRKNYGGDEYKKKKEELRDEYRMDEYDGARMQLKNEYKLEEYKRASDQIEVDLTSGGDLDHKHQELLYWMIEKVEPQSPLEDIDDPFARILLSKQKFAHASGLYEYSFLKRAGLSGYGELSATYKERPIEVRRQKANSDNLVMRETYRRLTQLSFDSGKIDAEEYKAIMGDNHCQKDDCLDMLCVEYKYLCCIDNPESTHCRK